MRQIGLFVDIAGLYSQILHHHKNRRLDYAKYYEFVSTLGDVRCAIAYGAQKNDEAEQFKHALMHIGFDTKYKRAKMDPKRGLLKANWNVTLTLDAVNWSENVDCLILGSTDKDLIPLIEWCKSKGIMVIVFAAGVNKAMAKAASRVIEIPESLLE
jgi:uncharacterized LabA/DUF88 family protein